MESRGLWDRVLEFGSRLHASRFFGTVSQGEKARSTSFAGKASSRIGSFQMHLFRHCGESQHTVYCVLCHNRCLDSVEEEQVCSAFVCAGLGL